MYLFTSILFCFFFNYQPIEVLQKDQTVLLKNIEQFDVDQFGNIYVTKKGELKKLDPNGKELSSYANPLLGSITSIDVTNAMNPLVFFDIANQMVVLDNRLNESYTNTFTDQGYIDVNLISFSDQDHIWLYDQNTDRLYRFNLEQRKKINQSLNITQLTATENEPTELITTFENLYLNVPDAGIMIFDAVGAFSKKIAVTKTSGLSIEANRLYFFKDKTITELNLKTNLEKKYYLMGDEPKQLRIKNGKLYSLTEKGLEIYSIPRPKK